MDNSKRQHKARRRGRGKWIVLIAVLSCAGVAAGGGWHRYQQNQAAQNEAGEPVYSYAQRMDMTNTFTSQGRIISTKSSASAAPQGYDSGYTVGKVMVKVGDTVKKGDPLYTIDTTAVQSEIDANEKKLALLQQQNSIDEQTKQRQLANAQAEAQQANADAQRALNDAADDTNDSLNTQNEGNADLTLSIQQMQEAQARVEEAQNRYNEANQKYNDLKARNDKAQEAIDTAQQLADIASAKQSRIQAELGDASGDEGYRQAADDAAQKAERLAQLKAANTQVSADLDKARDARDQASTDLDNAKAALETATSAAKTDLDSTKTNAQDVETKQRALEQAASDQQTKLRDSAETQSEANDALRSQRVANEQNLTDTQAAIAAGQEKIKGSTVTADIDGTVTAVNVTAGQAFSGTNAVVISDLSALTLATDVDEAHIASIHKDMKVTATTDSTGDTQLTGKVIYVADFPTPSAAGDSTSTTTAADTSGGPIISKQKAYYRVEISLDDMSQLREGMNARITFIVSESRDAIAVPQNAIYTDEETGGKYVLEAGDSTGEDALNGNSPEGSTWNETGETAGGAGGTEETSADGHTSEDMDAGAVGTDAAAEPAGEDVGGEDGTDSGMEDSDIGDSTRLDVTTGITQGDMVEITSGNVTEDMPLVTPDTYLGTGTGDTSAAGGGSSLLEGLYD